MAEDNAAEEAPQPIAVLVEMRVPVGTPRAFAQQMATGIEAPGFELDPEFEAMPMSPPPEEAEMRAAAGETVVLVRGMIAEDKISELEAQSNVIKVWRDTPIAPFPQAPERAEGTEMVVSPAAGPCPIPPCDCTFGNPANGTIAGVANYLGVNQIWSKGYQGAGIVIGIVDGGITAIGRPVKPGETARVPRVIGGWPTTDWGTTAAAWGNHGNMTATDALGMAPDAQIYDIRISGAPTMPGAISKALQGFQWAIDQYRTNGTPQILSNSWGMFQESWDPSYGSDPNHPFTRKVVEALDEGILVLFAAGNCGQTCPDGRCGSDNGPGKSIWGANGHPRVMTVGAVNIDEDWVGYSSQGPATLDPNKPDFCSITHFAGYFPTIDPGGTSDGGTSAATPIAAGVVALYKQKKPSLTQDQIKNAIKGTAKDIGPAGFDQHSGSGIMQAKAAYDNLFMVKLKFADDPVTLKFRDDPKLKIVDDPIKLKYRDDAKLKVADDPKLKVADDPKLKIADDPKLKIADDPKLKFADDRAGSAMPYQPPGGAGYGSGWTPFVLATPHHSMAWGEHSGGGVSAVQEEPSVAGYEAMISQYEEALIGIREKLEQATGEIEALDAQYQQIAEDQQALIEEYEQLKASGEIE